MGRDRASLSFDVELLCRLNFESVFSRLFPTTCNDVAKFDPRDVVIFGVYGG